MIDMCRKTHFLLLSRRKGHLSQFDNCNENIFFPIKHVWVFPI